MKSLRKIKSPAALAAFGAFFVPEPFGACLVLAAAIWWLYRRLIRNRSDGELVTAVATVERAEPRAPTAPASLAA